MPFRTLRTATPLALLLATGVGGCAHERGRQASSSPSGQAQRASSDAARQAAEADRALAQGRQQLEAAHRAALAAEQQRARAREQLAQADQGAAQAQARIGEAQANVQRLEAQARERRDRATEAALQAQAAAEAAQGLRSAQGRIAEATPTRLVLEVEGGPAMAFQLDQRTRVLVGTEQRSVAELQQGAQARVAYDAAGREPAAIAIHVSPAAGRRPAPAPPAQPSR